MNINSLPCAMGNLSTTLVTTEDQAMAAEFSYRDEPDSQTNCWRVMIGSPAHHVLYSSVCGNPQDCPHIFDDSKRSLPAEVEWGEPDSPEDVRVIDPQKLPGLGPRESGYDAKKGLRSD